MARTLQNTSPNTALSPRDMLLPLILAQFICSYAGSSMNVAISSIAADLGTTVGAIQTSITLFTLTMAALMIPGSKLSDIWGRKFCLILGLGIYGAGALIAAISQSIGVLTIGYSIFQGVGTAFLIPPVYILATIFFSDIQSRARAFGSISAAGGVGAAAGPLIGGLIISAVSWRLSFVLQVVVVVVIILLSRKIVDPGVKGAKPTFDILGAVLSAAGLIFVVIGILQVGTYGLFRAEQDVMIGSTVLIPQGGISPFLVFAAIGAVLLAGFFWHIRSMEQKGKEPLLPTAMFKNRTSNLGLVTQNIQWLVLIGLSFVVSVYLQEVRGYSAIQTGLILTPFTIGILVSSFAAGRWAKRFSQTLLIRVGFVITIVGVVLLLLLASEDSSVVSFFPGLLAVGLGVGMMLTSSVNVVQSSFSEEEQGEISGLSRSVSNLGSSLGVAIAGTVIVSSLVTGNQGYGLALIVLTIFALIGLGAALLLPTNPTPETAKADAGTV